MLYFVGYYFHVGTYFEAKELGFNVDMTCEWGYDRKEKYVQWYRQLSTQNKPQVIAKIHILDMDLQPVVPYKVAYKVSDHIIFAFTNRTHKYTNKLFSMRLFQN